MTRPYCISLIFILSLLGSCTSVSQSELSKALSAAVKENKISQNKMETILKEFETLRDEDKEQAREYAVKVVSALEMGGDSSHLDVVRRQVVRGKAQRQSKV
jgi:hypothetical protein